jgi:YbbR domain-containing protein
VNFLRELLTKDLGLKLFSLALALMIWTTVSVAIQKEVSPVTSLSLVSSERTFLNLPVVILSSADDVRNLKVNPKEVEVTVQGDAKTLNMLSSKDIRVLVDLTGIGAAHDLRKRIEVSTPAGVTHVRVDPQEVQVVYPPKS